MKDSNVDFKDKIGTVDSLGKRIWVYAKKPFGKFFNYRQIVGYTLLAILFIVPFIKVNGEPLVLFNIVERKFIILSMVFTTQDMYMFAIMMLILMVFIVLFTVVFGRLFCGWVCPQTIFMELVFRRIEYYIEGDYNQQKKLNNANWTSEKIFKKTSKHIIFFSIAFAIGNIFLAYIIGMDEVIAIITDPVSSHFSGLAAMIFFSLLFYGVFAFFREQVCVAVCPYGRLQSVMLDSNSIVVMYDWVRGEPRGKKRREKPSVEGFLNIDNTIPRGDCVDCDLCVKVCPTGIDIRNGTQLECVNCTACMDACDQVMEKVGREKGLIRYDAYDNIANHKIFKIFNKRAIAYSIVLGLLVVLQSFLLFNRSDAELVVQRTPGMLFQENEDGTVSNLYNYQIINKMTQEISDLELRVKDDIGTIKEIGAVNNVEMQETGSGSFFVILPEENIHGSKNKITIELYVNDKLIDKVKTNFLGPIK